MDAGKKHWVEELFPPRFTAQDLFFETHEPELLPSEKLAKDRARKTEEIYQAALCRLQEDNKQKRKAHLSNLVIRDYSPEAESHTVAQSATCTLCQKLSHSTSLAGDSSRCIWSEDELKLLRKAMNEKHAEGSRLKLQLNSCKLELSGLKAKQKKTEEDLEAVRAELAASKRASKCKGVLLQQMQKDSGRKDAELLSLKKELDENRAKMSNLTNRLCKASGEIQDLQLQNKDMEHKLHILKQQQGLRDVLAVENMKQKFSREVNKLRGEIEVAKAEGEKLSTDSYILKRS